MDLLMLLVSAVATLAAVASAVVAVAQARSARQSESDARVARDQAQVAERETLELSRVATAAFIRQAEAQEAANRLREEERKPPAWGAPRHVSGDLFQVVNTSGRSVTVEQWDVEPEQAESLVQVRTDSLVFAYGDSFDYLYSRRLGIRPRKLIVKWRFTDDPGGMISEFIIPL